MGLIVTLPFMSSPIPGTVLKGILLFLQNLTILRI